jgi:hypothetical protein
MIPLGAAPLLLTWRLHKGGWGHVLGPELRTATATIPLTVLLLVPLLMRDPAAGAAILVSWLIVWWCAMREDARIAPFGLIIYTVGTSFAGFYWVMGLQATADSAIFGLIVIAHQMVGALAFIVLLGLLRDDQIDEGTLTGLGNMLLGAVMLWAYFEFMQYLVAWSGDQPRLLAFFLPRFADAWGGIAIGVFVLQGGVPFTALLFQSVRRSRTWLIVLSALILAMRLLEGVWLVAPVIEAPLYALLLASVVGGAAWIFGYRYTFRKARYG